MASHWRVAELPDSEFFSPAARSDTAGERDDDHVVASGTPRGGIEAPKEDAADEPEDWF